MINHLSTHSGITQAAERRKQLIEESKYLGGDMEHTHLVKGLDYALLEKVRAEINHKEADDEDLEAAVDDEEDIKKYLFSRCCLILSTWPYCDM